LPAARPTTAGLASSCSGRCDVEEIDGCAIGVRARAVTPRRSIKRGEGQRDLVVFVTGARISPGDWVYADRDGVLVCARRLHD
jgi:regulator of ribonuclease activity A